DAAGAVTRVLATVEDVTERVRLEEQLRQASKMEAVGRLSGGVAHDFNNMLQSILGSADLLLADTPPEHAAYADLHEIRRAGRRAADLTRQLLAFSRQQVLAPRPLSLAESVAAIERMLGRMLGEDVELVTRLQADAGQVTADPTQVEQVLLNLAVNARDAMPDGGRLTIQVRGVELDADGIRRRSLDAEPGPYVLLEVGDTGRGMDAATQARIFEPFFTTKAVGQGTGLGLATVYGIVRQSGGAICVESSPGGGTRFSVFLPRIAAGGEGDAAPAAAAEPRAGSETVLVVEDEDAVRRLAGRVLRRYGYTMLEASSGHEAMAILREHAGGVNLLLTDAVMPHMGGRELVEAARAEFPALRVLFMSGYTSDAVVQRGVSEAELQFIQKPFSPHELGARVRSVLDGG
ncbi:MAG TPA: ATP-binding protein, partial [Longimicrobiaceae bacterium]|nr:ATP-binding protein [Longimicrobiaceae bacterium]